MEQLAAPTLVDADLRLRARRLDDLDALVAAVQDPEIPRWTRVPSPYTRADAEHSLSSGGEEDSVGWFAVDPHDRLLGSFSLMAIDRERGDGEIGYWLAAEARGRGVATRAVRLITDWAHGALGLRRVEIRVHHENGASLRVARRAGYRRLDGLHPSPRTGELDPIFVVFESTA